jgi:hypothetical protein
LRLRTLPGEQAQVDWGHFGHLAIGRARRPLMAFVMVLSYSRQIFLRFFLNARVASCSPNEALCLLCDCWCRILRSKSPYRAPAKSLIFRW